MKVLIQSAVLFTLLAVCITACVARSVIVPTKEFQIMPIATEMPEAAYGGEPENDTITLVPPQAIKIAMVAIEDSGVSGPTIGCGDSVVMIEFPYLGGEPLTEALTVLLSVRGFTSGGSGLYTAFNQSDLQVERVETYHGFTEVYLAGQLMMGGECDIPRVQAQLEYTAKQFPEVVNLTIFLNGELLADALSLK